jgi:hypothetical protein
MNAIPRYNSAIHHRRSIRLRGYDYSRYDAYFITLCAHNREWLFGEIVDREIQSLVPTADRLNEVIMATKIDEE